MKHFTNNCKSFSIILRKSESKLFYWILFSVKNLLIDRAPTSKGRTTFDVWKSVKRSKNVEVCYLTIRYWHS